MEVLSYTYCNIDTAISMESSFRDYTIIAIGDNRCHTDATSCQFLKIHCLIKVYPFLCSEKKQ